MRILFTALSFVVAAVWSFPNFSQLFPNADRVQFGGHAWKAVGHSNPQGGGALNAFGIDFKEAGNKWTKELCQLDSDGDGRSNGEELGDPFCTWKRGDPPPQVDTVSHPGVAEWAEDENDL